jgi:hypothetical protein
MDMLTIRINTHTDKTAIAGHSSLRHALGDGRELMVISGVAIVNLQTNRPLKLEVDWCRAELRLEIDLRDKLGSEELRIEQIVPMVSPAGWAIEPGEATIPREHTEVSGIAVDGVSTEVDSSRPTRQVVLLARLNVRSAGEFLNRVVYHVTLIGKISRSV